MTFEERYPALFHVTERAAVAGIRREGLVSARVLVERHGGADGGVALWENRAGWVGLAPGVSLRRQGLRDGALRPRLEPGISCAAWRFFINGLVFFFPTLALAERMLSAEPARDQVVLRYGTADLIVAGAALSVCRFNNGYIDRMPLATARLRHYSDYRPVAEWDGAAPKEVVAAGGIPAGVAFAVLRLP